MSSSIPFATSTIICPSGIIPFNLFDVNLTKEDATAITIISASFTATSKSFVISIFSGIITPGRLILFSLVDFSSSTSLSRADQITTSFPFSNKTFANAIAQPPPPNTVTFDMLCLLFLTNFSFRSISQSLNIVFMSDK